MLKDVEQAELGIQLSGDKRVGGTMFANDFVGVSKSRESPQKLIDGYCSTHVSGDCEYECSMKNSVQDGWKWGEHKLSKVSS